MNYAIELEQEDDGRWIAEIPALPGVMAYGVTKADAESKVEALAVRVKEDHTEREVTRAAAHLSETAFEAVWSNPEDDTYDTL